MRISDWSSDVCSSDLALAEIAAVGEAGIAETVDVADEASVERLRDAVAERLGGLDILVNNAGIDPHYALLQDTPTADRSEEHTSELQSLMRISYAVFCLKKKKHHYNTTQTHNACLQN